MPNMDWICSAFKNETILSNDFHFFSIPLFLVMVKNEEPNWNESTIKIQSIPSDCTLWWWRLKEKWNFEKKSRKNICYFFGFERYTILSHAVCKKSLNWWIFVIQGCVDHGWNPFFIYKNRSVPLIGGPCKKMIYFLNLLRTSHRVE